MNLTTAVRSPVTIPNQQHELASADAHLEADLNRAAPRSSRSKLEEIIADTLLGSHFVRT
jgi:hypothetical protein